MGHKKSVAVEAMGILKQYVKQGATVHNADTVGEVITQLNLPETGELILLVNGRLAYWQTAVADGDVVKLVPAISGGLCASPSKRRGGGAVPGRAASLNIPDHFL